MRTIYLTSGDVIATTSEKDFQSGNQGVGAGIMLGADGRTVGFDLFCEVKPNVWVPADQLPAGVLSEERRRGTLESGIFYAGKFISRLNVNNVRDRLIASKFGLELKPTEYKGGATAFKAETVNVNMDYLKKVIEDVKQRRETEQEQTLNLLAEVELLEKRLLTEKNKKKRRKDEENYNETVRKIEDSVGLIDYGLLGSPRLFSRLRRELLT